MNADLNTRSARAAIFWRVHWWAALVASPFAVLATLTGLLYVGTPQIEQSLYGHLEQVAPVQQALPLDQLVANARAAAPEGMALQQVVVGAASHEALKVIFAPRVASADPHAHHHGAGQAASAAGMASTAAPTGIDQAAAAPRKRAAFGLPAGAVTLYLDPATGHVLGSLAQDSRFSQWAKHLHSRLLQGEGWRWMIELAASWMMVMLITGVALWWPQAGWPRRGRTGRAFWREWHSFAGVALGLVSLVILATGLTWSKYSGDEVRMLRDLAGQAPPQMPSGLRSSAVEGSAPLSWQAALQAARAMAPAASLQLTPPRSADGIWRISMADRRQPTLRFEAAMDAYSGAALYTSGWQEQTAFGKATAIGIPFHRGEFGWWNQAVLLVFGLGVLFSLISGWLMYFKRRKAGQLSLPRVPAGAWRALGAGWWSGALACLALMPLLLLSAPVVLLLDRLVASRQVAQA
jgi:uncharacterized iron-regulated membrane protein